MFKLWDKIKNWNKKNRIEIESADQKKKKAEEHLESVLKNSNDPTSYEVYDSIKYDKPSYGPDGGITYSNYKY